jgi:rare lipoprotein A (peptidoglycan hydrolase)
MMALSNSCRTKHIRLANIGWSALALAAMVLPVKLASTAEAKTPGSTYCYHGTCHRVKTIAETQALVGVEQAITASHYDDCSRDRYNPCGLTSSGERFHPDRPDNTASPIYPDGTTLLVWSPETKRALVVRVNNAGPYWGNRTLDLSRAAAEKLGFEGKGVAKLRVQVIKAPEPAEAKYVRNRNYPPVPGDIGTYKSLARAETGMAVALALQASAASPMAPVTTANAFGRSEESEPIVAEAPQVLGRRGIQVASMLPQPERSGFSLGASNSNQSHRHLAALSGDPAYQSRWREEGVNPISTGSLALATPDTPEQAKLETLAALESTPAIDKTERIASVGKSAHDAEVSKLDKVEKIETIAKAERVKGEKVEKPARVASVAEPDAKADEKPAVKRAARRNDEDEEESSGSSRRRTAYARERGSHSQGRRIARAAGRYAGDRYAYMEQRTERSYPERSAGEIMSLGIRARSSSTM